uniref:Uncharacterized protein n=1 Tax=Taeniopygia guttata TaxID=59729 RepID=A0A674G967_TAEGU
IVVTKLGLKIVQHCIFVLVKWQEPGCGTVNCFKMGNFSRAAGISLPLRGAACSPVVEVFSLLIGCQVKSPQRQSFPPFSKWAVPLDPLMSVVSAPSHGRPARGMC